MNFSDKQTGILTWVLIGGAVYLIGRSATGLGNAAGKIGSTVSDILPDTTIPTTATKCKSGDGPGSFPDVWYVDQADALNAVFFELWPSDSEIQAIFAQIRTTCDMVLLQAAFGKRRDQYTVSLTTLSAFVSRHMSKEHIQQINDDFAARGINYRF